ncbi:MAG: PEP-CTERM sorting domain-containing protein [Roseibacillus sp.]
MGEKIAAFLFVVALAKVQAATFVLDSFDSGSFSLSESGQHFDSDRIGSPLGFNRDVRIRSGLATPGTSMMSVLNSSTDTLSLNFNGESESSIRPLDFRVSYKIGEPFSLLGSTAFELDLSAFSGAGFLVVELGGGDTGFYGPNANRIALNGPGTLTVPFSELNFSPGSTIDSFSSTRFVFEAESEQFSLTLDEIRVVPEPSSFLFLSLAGLFGVTKRLRCSSSSEKKDSEAAAPN